MPTVLFVCTANFYRSRFAEHLFNHLARQAQINWTAISRGVATELGADNIGSISSYAIRALATRGVALARPIRDPLPLTEQELLAADLVIVLDETEYRPFMGIKFPNWADKVTYWHVGDLHLATAEEALALAEQNIRTLLGQLATDAGHTVTRAVPPARPPPAPRPSSAAPGRPAG